MAPMGGQGDSDVIGGWNFNPNDRSTWVVTIACILVGAWVFVWSVCLLGLYTARKQYSSRPRSPFSSSPSNAVPGVSIIRPLRGLDPNLYYNLESCMLSEYSKFEVIFAVQREDDQALEVVRSLLEKYPGVDARIVVSTEVIGVNPKINNLNKPFSLAQYDILWVLDATISVLPTTLGRSIDALITPPITSTRQQYSSLSIGEDGDGETMGLNSKVGLVHHVPFAFIPQKSWGARLEQAYLNTTHAKMYLAINATKVESCVVGKSNLYRRSAINSLQTPSPTLRALPTPPTGLAGYSTFLAEDNMIALGIMHQLKLSHSMTGDLAMDCLGPITLDGYIARRIRWIRVRKTMTLPATLAEPFTESILLGLLTAWALHVLVGFPRWIFFPLHMLAWLWTDLSVMSALKGGGLEAEERWDFVTAWACREMLALPIWLRAIVGNEVVWRGVPYRMLWSGEAVRIDR